MKKPSMLTLLYYAMEGIRTSIGSHPAPNEWPEEIETLKFDLKHVKKLIKQLEKRNGSKERL